MYSVTEPRPDPSRTSDVAAAAVQLAAFSAYPMLSFATQNFSRGLDGVTLGTIGAMVFGAAIIATAVLARVARFGLHRATAVVSFLILGMFSWQWLGGGHRPPTSMSGLAHLSAAVVLLVLMRLAFGLARHREFRAAVLFMALFVAGSSAARLTVKHVSIDPASLPMGPVVDARPGPRPDVHLIVLDGYGRQDALSMFLGYDNGPFLRELRRRGFAVAPRASTAYSMTVASIPSMLTMEYPVGRASVFDEAQELALYRVLHGDNPVVRSLKGAGYRYVHIESGWVGTRCGPLVDECIPESVVGNDANGLISYTPVRSLFARWFHRDTAAGRLDRFDRLDEVAARPSRMPRFVFTHVLLPHPPLFVDRQCRIHAESWRRGNVVAVNPAREGRRRAAYVEQVECVNRRVLRALDRIPADAAVVIVSDHGPDSIGEQLKLIADWTPADITERLGTLAALRLPRACPVPADLVAPNLMRVTLNCLLGGDLPLLPERHYVHKERGGAREIPALRRTMLVPLERASAPAARRVAEALYERYGIDVDVAAAPAPSSATGPTASALSRMRTALPQEASDPRRVLVGITESAADGIAAVRGRHAVVSTVGFGSGPGAEVRLRKIVARLIGLLQYRLQPPAEPGGLLAGDPRTPAQLDALSDDFFPGYLP